MKILIKFRNYILYTGVALTLIMLGLFLFFGNSQDKINISMLSIVISLLFYCFARFGFEIILRNASKKMVLICSYIYIITSALGLLFSIIPSFIVQFPNGYASIITGAFAVAVMIGTIDYNRKHNFDNEQ